MMLTPEQLAGYREQANGVGAFAELLAHIDAQQANIAELEAKWLAEREAYLQERNKCEQLEENAQAHKLAMQASKAMLQAETARADKAEAQLALHAVMDGRQIDYAAMAEVGDIASGKAVGAPQHRS